MHLQNRVTPFGEIVAISQRGMFTGNRGIIHDPVTKTLLTRRWTTKTWLVCSCEYRGRRRSVMAGRSWTELFFLDEAVALLTTPIDIIRETTAVMAAGSAFTLSSGLAYRWTKEGYDPPVPLHRADGLLTPPSTLMALSAGYRPVLHPSITWLQPRTERRGTTCRPDR